MKLIIQIPCYNEEQTLPVTLACLPRVVNGFDTVEWLVVDDGSSDNTAAVALACGVDHIVRHEKNSGLAKAFMTGIAAALAHGADVIVNTDGDNQYNAADIPLLLEPILAGRAGFVVGIRPVYAVKTMPLLIKLLHRFGSLIVMKASGTNISDPPSGFRAFSREVAERLRVFNCYTYTLETIIQAGNTGINVVPVNIRINPGKLRISRLMSSPYSYVAKSASIILRALLYYNPKRFLSTVALPLLLLLVAAAYAVLVHPGTLTLTIFTVIMITALYMVFISYPVLFSCGVFARTTHFKEDG